MALVRVVLEILKKPSIGDVMVDLMILVAPLWIAVVVGVLVGWAWKPKWANFPTDSLLPDSFKIQLSSSLTRFSDFSPLRRSSSSSSAAPATVGSNFSSSSNMVKEDTRIVTERDLEHLYKLAEVKDGGPAWIQMMDRLTPTMSYQAWRRDLENGPPQYRSRTVFEDATPEMVRDFFWDDEFRLKWDEMLLHAQTLEECSTTGGMIVQWVRKFPFFCSNREYIISRRMWDSGRVFYVVTKDVPYSSVPKKDKPRRVDSYYSSWRIRAVESKNGNGWLTACEVLLFHHEEMGIPWEIAKLGVRQGMWGTVKKIDPGLRLYQKQRASGAPLSHCAIMAQINTKVSENYLKSLKATNSGSSEVDIMESSEKPEKRNIPRMLVIGGAIALACTLDKGLVTKAIIFGVARRFANLGRKL